MLSGRNRVLVFIRVALAGCAVTAAALPLRSMTSERLDAEFLICSCEDNGTLNRRLRNHYPLKLD